MPSLSTFLKTMISASTWGRNKLSPPQRQTTRAPFTAAACIISKSTNTVRTPTLDTFYSCDESFSTGPREEIGYDTQPKAHIIIQDGDLTIRTPNVQDPFFRSYVEQAYDGIMCLLPLDESDDFVPPGAMDVMHYSIGQPPYVKHEMTFYYGNRRAESWEGENALLKRPTVEDVERWDAQFESKRLVRVGRISGGSSGTPSPSLSIATEALSITHLPDATTSPTTGSVAGHEAYTEFLGTDTPTTPALTSGCQTPSSTVVTLSDVADYLFFSEHESDYLPPRVFYVDDLAGEEECATLAPEGIEGAHEDERSSNAHCGTVSKDSPGRRAGEFRGIGYRGEHVVLEVMEQHERGTPGLIVTSETLNSLNAILMSKDLEASGARLFYPDYPDFCVESLAMPYRPKSTMKRLGAIFKRPKWTYSWSGARKRRS